MLRQALRRTGSVRSSWALFCVWVTFIASAVVFTEPAPVDVLMLGCIVMLPVIRLVRITPPLLVYLAIWLVAGACALVGTVHAIDVTKALVHTAVTFFLTLSSFVIAAFVMRPGRAYTAHYECLCDCGGDRGQPGVARLFSSFSGCVRSLYPVWAPSGSSKDPNVFAPFLMPPILYLLNEFRRARRACHAGRDLGGAAWSGCGSVSRGAWIDLAVALSIPGVRDRADLQRLKILGAGSAAWRRGLARCLWRRSSSTACNGKFESRATLDQSLCRGAGGAVRRPAEGAAADSRESRSASGRSSSRRSTTWKSRTTFISQCFDRRVLFSWLVDLRVDGVPATCLYGLRHAFRRTRTQALFIIIAIRRFAAVCALEGFVIEHPSTTGDISTC